MTLFLFDRELRSVLRSSRIFTNCKRFRQFFLYEIRISLCSEVAMGKVLVKSPQSQGQILDNFSVLLLHHVICEHHQVA